LKNPDRVYIVDWYPLLQLIYAVLIEVGYFMLILLLTLVVFKALTILPISAKAQFLYGIQHY